MLDDEQLVGMLRKGDDDAFSELVTHLGGRLLRLARTIVATQELAEEVVQDTWIAVIRGLDGFEGRSSLQTWIYRICVNRARSSAEREGRTLSFDPQEPGVEATWFSPNGAWATPVEPWPDAVESRLDAATLLPRIREAIDRLPTAQRLVVTLRDVEGLSGIEVCDVLAITEANQRVLLHRGRNQLRSALGRLAKGG